MILDNQFHVQVPPSRLRPLLLDMERVSHCLPGAIITGRASDSTYEGTVTVRVGPLSVTYSETDSHPC